MEAPPSTVDGHHRATHRRTQVGLWYPSRIHVSGRVDIFDMVNIDLFTIIALNMMVLKLGYTGKSEPIFYNYLKPLTNLDKGLYALAYEEDVRCLGTLVRSFKLIEVYIEHGVTSLDSYLRAPQFRATLEEITDEASSITANRTKKIFDINLSFVLQQATASQVIDDVMRQLSFDETKLDGEAGFADVAGSGMDSSGLSHDESFRVDDLDLNSNKPEPILSEVSTQEPIVAEVSTQEPNVAKVSTKVPIVEEVGTQEFSVEDVVLEDYVSSRKDGEDAEQGIDTAYETEYDVQPSEDAGTDDDDDVDEDFLVDEDNEIVEPDVDVHLFGISMDLPFDNTGITNLVSDDVLEGEGVDVINADGFNSNSGNGEEKYYRKRSQKFTTPKEAKDRVYLHSIKSRRNLKLYKNDGVRIRAICDGKVFVFTMSQGLDGAFTKGPFPRQVLVAVGLDSNNGIYPLAYALVEAESKSSWCWFLQCLGDDIDLHPNSNFTFISDRQKGIIPAIKTVYPSRAKSDLLLNNICEVFNGKIVGGRDKSVITLLEYIKEYCMKRIMNVQGVIDKCTGPLTPILTRIMESIKKEAHLMKVKWNGANKKWELTGIPCKHVVAAYWNMALNDCAAPPQKLGTKYREKSTCPTTLLPPKHHVQVGRLRKKRKRSKHEDEPFVKDGKLSRKGRTITCQSCGNTGHNKATCKGQGRKATTGSNNAQASSSAYGQAQQTEPAVGQDGLSGSGAGAVIGLFAAAGEGGAGVSSQGLSRSRWTKRRVQTERISPQKRTLTQPASQPSTSSQVPVSETRNADGREMG
ncbi:putative transposase, mutator type, MULE transposase domain protein [Tanacetum coccineum]